MTDQKGPTGRSKPGRAKAPPTCLEWSRHQGEKEPRPCGRRATKKYNLDEAIENLVKPDWIPVCALHARVVSRHYCFTIRDL
jgi:hypothetical protein